MIKYEIVSMRAKDGSRPVSAYMERTGSSVVNEPSNDLGKQLLELHLKVFQEQKANLLETKVEMKF